MIDFFLNVNLAEIIQFPLRILVTIGIDRHFSPLQLLLCYSPLRFREHVVTSTCYDRDSPGN